jgi:hypothetical protein
MVFLILVCRWDVLHLLTITASCVRQPLDLLILESLFNGHDAVVICL